MAEVLGLIDAVELTHQNLEEEKQTYADLAALADAMANQKAA